MVFDLRRNLAGRQQETAVRFIKANGRLYVV
jgi:hypothetical protein